MSQESQSVRSVLGAELADIPVFRKVSRANLWKAAVFIKLRGQLLVRFADCNCVSRF